MQVFVSYRRSDASGHAGRLHDSLVARLGTDNVFQDVAAIGPGRDFTQELNSALDGCDAALVVMGPSWATAATEAGPRLHEDGDYVRLELATALARGIPVVPVLVAGAQLPTAEALPDDLRPLLQRQAVVLHDESWHQDVLGLLRALEGERDDPGGVTASRRWLAGGVVLAAVATAVWLSPLGPESDDEGAAEPPPCEAATGESWQDLGGLSEVAVATGDSAEGFDYRVTEGRWRAADDGTWRLLLTTRAENTTATEAYHGQWLYDAVIVGQRTFDLACYSADPELVLAGTVGRATAGFDVACEPAGFIELLVGPQGSRLAVTDPASDPAPC